ncbi:hypothetical protein F4Z99_00315 [Candidatus Poribacteria bacterium]|nr:hypothetical protein [Candidatus Poribacteria bacterium]MYA98614.1 hypothetical protein [Candidatus Poribacteria bacterium]
MNQELIDQIRKIVERVLEEQASTTTQIADEKRLLAIFGATQLELDEPLQQLQACTQDGWKITIILSDLATKVINPEPIHAIFGEENVLREDILTNIATFVDTYQQIVLPVFSHPMAAKLALRLVDTPCTYLVFEALSKGKTVIAVTDALNQNGSSAKINAIEVEYVNVLSELGVQWVPMMQIAESIKNRTDDSPTSLDRPLISATTILNLDTNVQELVHAKRAIITPLAREHAKKRGIKLIPKS